MPPETTELLEQEDNREAEVDDQMADEMPEEEESDNAGELEEPETGQAEGQDSNEKAGGYDDELLQIKQQLAQTNQAIQGMAQMVQRIGTRPPAFRQPQGPPTKSDAELDNMTGQELHRYTSQQIQAGVQRQNTAILTEAANQFVKTHDLIFLLLGDHPKATVAHQALAMSIQRPDLSIRQAFDICEGLASKGRNEQLEKKVNSFRKANSKRADKARRGSMRPGNTPQTRSVKVHTIREAMQEEAKRLGMA